jgi:hypothetical protein
MVPKPPSSAGVRLRKAAIVEVLNERQRADAAQTLARDWRAYCKFNSSMAFASANGDRILIQYRRVDSMETFNLLELRVLDRDFEVDGKVVANNEMERLVFEALDSRKLP